jgi:Lipase (class 3)
MLEEVKNAALLCEAIYSYPSGIAITWDYLSEGPVYWGLKEINGTNYVCFRGSTTPEDWLRDLNAFANPLTHSDLGPIHPGFFYGMPEVWAELKSKVTANLVLTGHSLGSGEVDVCAGLAVIDGVTPKAKIGFGSPKAGFKQLGQIVKNIPDFCFRNTDGLSWDLITSVPFTFFPEEYQHTAPLFDVCCTPQPNDDWGPFAWHHMQAYRTAVNGLTEAGLTAHHEMSTKRRIAYYQPARSN